MKMRRFGVLAGAVLLALTGLAQAKTIDIAPPPAKMIVKPAAAPRVPVHTARKVSRTRKARSISRAYYDYYDAREVSENIDGGSRYSQLQPAPDDRSRYGYDESRYDRADSAPPPQTRLDTSDFNGGVGYGQTGDMGYQGGYGRFDPYNGNTGMNGGGMANAAAARFSVWHGYNSRNGLGNGY